MKDQELKNSTMIVFELRTTLAAVLLAWTVSVAMAFVVGMATYRNMAYLLVG